MTDCSTRTASIPSGRGQPQSKPRSKSPPKKMSMLYGAVVRRNWMSGCWLLNCCTRGRSQRIEKVGGQIIFSSRLLARVWRAADAMPARRRQLAYGRDRGLSARRACTLFSPARSALRYRDRKVAKDVPVIERMKALSAQYRRYGYRRIRIFLCRDGHRMSVGRACRLRRTAGLQVPRKRSRKQVAAARPRPQTPTRPNQVWSYDFVFDRCANGQQLKCLIVTDEFTKEGLAIAVDGRIRSPRVRSKADPIMDVDRNFWLH
jgi:transposase InsO family protein